LGAGAGCLAGEWPDLNSNGICRPPGALSDSQAVLWDGAGTPKLPPLNAPAGTPPLDELPALLDTRFCHGPGGKTRICGSDEKGCGAGAMPDPDAPDTCMPVGVPWLCPPGFITKPGPELVDDLRDCVPDPKDCGDDPFGGVKEGPKVVFVDASATPGGDGSRAKPYVSLSKAVTESSSGGTVAIAAGVYKDSLFISHPVQLLGRCAALVRLQAAGKYTAAIWVEPKSPASKVLVRGLTLKGDRWGMIAKDKADVHVQRVWVNESSGVGIASFGGSLDIQDTVVARTKAGYKDWRGQGIGLGWKGKVSLRRVRLTRNREAAVISVGQGTTLHADRVLIDGTRPNVGLHMAVGLAILNSTAHLRSVRVSHHRAQGLRAHDAHGTVSAKGLLVDHCGVNNPMARGEGIYVQGAHASLVGVRLHKNRAHGAFALAPGTTLDANALIVDQTLESLSPKSGNSGITIQKGASGSLTSLRTSANPGVGLAMAHVAAGVAATLEVRGLLADGTRTGQTELARGQGLVVAGNAKVLVRDARLSDNRHAGLVVGADTSPLPTSVDVKNMLIDGTRPNPNVASSGYGVAVQAGARLRLTDVRLSDNYVAGLNAFGVGAEVHSVRILVDGTRPLSNGQGLGAVAAGNGARVDIVNGWLVGNAVSGATVRNPGSRLTAMGVLIQNTKATKFGFAAGLYATEGGQLVAQGGRLTGAQGVGAGSHGYGATSPVPLEERVDTHATLVGMRIENTLPGTIVGDREQGQAAVTKTDGIGLSVYRPEQNTKIVSSLFRANRTAGVSFIEGGGVMTGCVVVETLASTHAIKLDARGKPTQTAELADAVIARDVGEVHIARTLVAGHLRAGFLLDGSGKVTVTDSLATKGAYGIVTQAGVQAELARNLLYDNTTNLSGDTQLYVPPAPRVQGR